MTACSGIILDMTGRRMFSIAGAALCAVLIGGVAQTYAWRWGVDPVTKVTNSQFAWLLLCFVVAWARARGRVLSGIVAGGLTGVGLIASYYCVQWFADGWHAAASQFSGTYGLAWTVAATGGGALVGGLGALAGSAAETKPTQQAVGLMTAALIVGLGPLVWFMANGDVLRKDGIWVAIAFYGAVGVLLGTLALRKCGISAAMRGLGLGAMASSVVLAGLLALQSTVLYTTF